MIGGPPPIVCRASNRNCVFGSSLLQDCFSNLKNVCATSDPRPSALIGGKISGR
jgi:hypothetical protein